MQRRKTDTWLLQCRIQSGNNTRIGQSLRKVDEHKHGASCVDLRLLCLAISWSSCRLYAILLLSFWPPSNPVLGQIRENYGPKPNALAKRTCQKERRTHRDWGKGGKRGVFGGEFPLKFRLLLLTMVISVCWMCVCFIALFHFFIDDTTWHDTQSLNTTYAVTWHFAYNHNISPHTDNHSRIKWRISWSCFAVC